MTNRQHFPKDLITKATKQNMGWYDYRCNGCLLTIVWVDKSLLCMITNIHEPVVSIQPTVKKRKDTGNP